MDSNLGNGRKPELSNLGRATGLRDQNRPVVTLGNSPSQCSLYRTVSMTLHISPRLDVAVYGQPQVCL